MRLFFLDFKAQMADRLILVETTGGRELMLFACFFRAFFPLIPKYFRGSSGKLDWIMGKRLPPFKLVVLFALFSIEMEFKKDVRDLVLFLGQDAR